MNLLYISH